MYDSYGFVPFRKSVKKINPLVHSSVSGGKASSQKRKTCYEKHERLHNDYMFSTRPRSGTVFVIIPPRTIQLKLPAASLQPRARE